VQFSIQKLLLASKKHNASLCTQYVGNNGELVLLAIAPIILNSFLIVSQTEMRLGKYVCVRVKHGYKLLFINFSHSRVISKRSYATFWCARNRKEGNAHEVIIKSESNQIKFIRYTRSQNTKKNLENKDIRRT